MRNEDLERAKQIAAVLSGRDDFEAWLRFIAQHVEAERMREARR